MVQARFEKLHMKQTTYTIHIFIIINEFKHEIFTLFLFITNDLRFVQIYRRLRHLARNHSS